MKIQEIIAKAKKIATKAQTIYGQCLSTSFVKGVCITVSGNVFMNASIITVPICIHYFESGDESFFKVVLDRATLAKRDILPDKIKGPSSPNVYILP